MHSTEEEELGLSLPARFVFIALHFLDYIESRTSKCSSSSFFYQTIGKMGVQANHVNISSLNMINNVESRVRHATGIDRKSC